MTTETALSLSSETGTPVRRSARALFTRDEIAQLIARSDRKGWQAVLFTWAVIAAAFTLLALQPGPLTFILAVIVLGGRQLALAVLSHEAAHRTLFRTPWLNDVIGDWLCARLVWNDVPRYREHHLRHHAHTGTGRDPDLSLVTPFPTTRRSLAMKVLRDLTGQTGLRRIAGQFLMDIGVYRYTVAAEVERLPRNGRGILDYARAGIRNMTGVVLSNAALAAVLAMTGGLWLYWAWVVAYLTVFSLVIRIRSIAEHACMERHTDMLRNTRTTHAGWLARMTVAPMSVNYHQEHHLMASVPYHRLPLMHRWLRERGVVTEPPGYLDVLRKASAGTAT
jgi:fatty acid desaturase